MARTKTKKTIKTATKQQKQNMANGQARRTPEQLYASALELVEQSRPAEALIVAKQLLEQVRHRSVTEALPAVNLLGDISIELGAVSSARDYFEEAVRLDPDGQIPEVLGGGAEKFLWLAQLSEDGGKQSVEWFEKGAKALQREITAIESGQLRGLSEEQLLMMRVEKKRKLANALCGIVEVYMTDLSWDEDAEARCENLITEAMAAEEETSPEVLQTLASVRLSQFRTEDAQSALRRSLATWVNLEPEDSAVPDFATKISLSRLLMEAEMNAQAMGVLDRLIQEDDQSIEAWYLGGWCQYLIAEHKEANADDSIMEANGNAPSAGQPGCRQQYESSRRWLKTALRLYTQLEYEDDRLFDHAKELVEKLDTVLGPEDEHATGEDQDDREDEWSGLDEDEEDEDEDEDMQDS